VLSAAFGSAASSSNYRLLLPKVNKGLLSVPARNQQPTQTFA